MAREVEGDTSGPWSVSRGEYDGKPLIVRLNDGLRGIAGHKRYSFQAGVAIHCNHPDEHGLRSPSDTNALNDFEDQFQRLLCRDQLALLAAPRSSATCCSTS